MGKGRDKRRGKSREPARYTIVTKRSDPPIPDEPDAPVYSPLKPKPRPQAPAIAIPEPDPEDSFIVVGLRTTK